MRAQSPAQRARGGVLVHRERGREVEEWAVVILDSRCLGDGSGLELTTNNPDLRDLQSSGLKLKGLRHRAAKVVPLDNDIGR